MMELRSRTLTSTRRAACVALLLAAAADAAAAEPALAIANLNLRQGPGLNFGVLVTIPGGSTVDVAGCSGDWCNIRWGGRIGYVVGRNLDMGGPPPLPGAGRGPGPVVVGPPPPEVYLGPPAVVVEPPDYYDGPGYYGPGYHRPGYYYGPRWRRW